MASEEETELFGPAQKHPLEEAMSDKPPGPWAPKVQEGVRPPEDVTKFQPNHWDKQAEKDLGRIGPYEDIDETDKMLERRGQFVDAEGNVQDYNFSAHLAWMFQQWAKGRTVRRVQPEGQKPPPYPPDVYIGDEAGGQTDWEDVEDVEEPLDPESQKAYDLIDRLRNIHNIPGYQPPHEDDLEELEEQYKPYPEPEEYEEGGEDYDDEGLPQEALEQSFEPTPFHKWRGYDQRQPASDEAFTETSEMGPRPEPKREPAPDPDAVVHDDTDAVTEAQKQIDTFFREYEDYKKDSILTNKGWNKFKKNFGKDWSKYFEFKRFYETPSATARAGFDEKLTFSLNTTLGRIDATVMSLKEAKTTTEQKQIIADLFKYLGKSPGAKKHFKATVKHIEETLGKPASLLAAAVIVNIADGRITHPESFEVYGNNVRVKLTVPTEFLFNHKDVFNPKNWEKNIWKNPETRLQIGVKSQDKDKIFGFWHTPGDGKYGGSFSFKITDNLWGTVNAPLEKGIEKKLSGSLTLTFGKNLTPKKLLKLQKEERERGRETPIQKTIEEKLPKRQLQSVPDSADAKFGPKYENAPLAMDFSRDLGVPKASARQLKNLADYFTGSFKAADGKSERPVMSDFWLDRIHSMKTRPENIPPEVWEGLKKDAAEQVKLREDSRVASEVLANALGVAMQIGPLTNEEYEAKRKEGLKAGVDQWDVEFSIKSDRIAGELNVENLQKTLYSVMMGGQIGLKRHRLSKNLLSIFEPYIAIIKKYGSKKNIPKKGHGMSRDQVDFVNTLPSGDWGDFIEFWEQDKKWHEKQDKIKRGPRFKMERWMWKYEKKWMEKGMTPEEYFKTTRTTV